MNLSRQTKGHGPTGGICIVGDSPSNTDIAKGVPFVGRAGQVLRRKLKEAGIDPLRVRFENVVERKLDVNEESTLYWDQSKLEPKDELHAWWLDLHARLKKGHYKVIIAAGDLAMRALTYETSITNCQCYVIKDTRINHGIPIIPMYHPKFVYQQPELGIWLGVALQKAALIASGSVDVNEVRVYHIEPKLSDVRAFCQRAMQTKEICLDIETFKGAPHEITCIGIAISPKEAMSIPLAGSSGKPYWPKAEELEVWKLLKELLAAPQVGKILQNFIFDTMMLSKFGLEVSGPITDTMELSNLINPELKKSLKAIAQVYLFCEPWKSGQDWNLKGSTYKDLWLYNAKDCAYTYEIAVNQREGLQSEGLLAYYEKYRAPLYERIYEICARGWNVDHKAKEELTHDLSGIISDLNIQLVSMATSYLGPGQKKKKRRDPESDTIDSEGEKVKAYKTIVESVPREFNPASPAQVKEVLTNMGVTLPRYKGKVTSDERALLKVNRKYGLAFIPKLLEYRHNRKLHDTYCKVTLDTDNRYRFSVNIAGTKSGRLSSQMTAWGTGGNSQNIPKNFRQIIIPDPGYHFCQVDLSQAELRVVAWLAGEEKLISMLDNGEDIHQFTANEISKIAKMEASRQLGKQANHAGNYGIGPNKFSDLCLTKCGLAITKKQAQEILTARLKLFPQIANWQADVKQTVYKTRRLVTPIGRSRTFFGRLDEELEREALSFVPQSLVVDILNLAWIRMAEEELFKDDVAQFLQQGHDSLLIQVKGGRMRELYDIINRTFKNLTFDIAGNTRVIPWDISAGENWRDLEEIQ